MPMDSGATLATYKKLEEPTGRQCRVFLSHAGEEKQDFMVFVKETLENWHFSLRGGAVFLDEDMMAGTAAMRCMHDKLADASVVVLVLSEAFINKPYPMEELHLLLERERSGVKTAYLVPMLYDISFDDLETKRLEYLVLAGELDELHTHCAPCPEGRAEYVSRFSTHANTLGSLAELFRQYAQDLKDIPFFTALRPDQTNSRLVRRDCVVRAVISGLSQQGHVLRTVDLPAEYVQDEASVDRLVQDLTCGPRGKACLLSGMAAMGKSVLAKAAYNQLVEEYPDKASLCIDLQNQAHPTEAGIKEVQLSIIGQLSTQAQALRLSASTAHERRQEIASQMEGKKVVVLVDNAHPTALDLVLPRTAVQGGRVANPLELLHEDSVVLITSRAAQLGTQYQGSQYTCLPLQSMDETTSKKVLFKYFNSNDSSGNVTAIFPDPAAAQQLVVACSGCPVALAAAGAYMQKNELCWVAGQGCGAQAWLLEAVGDGYTKEPVAGLLKSFEPAAFPGGTIPVQVAFPVVSSTDMLLDIAFYVGENQQPAQLFDWALQDSEREALGRLGVVSQSGTTLSLHKVLADICTAMKHRAVCKLQRIHVTKMMKRNTNPATPNGPRAVLEDLHGCWLHDTVAWDPSCLLKHCGKDLRLLQLAFGLKPRSSILLDLGWFSMLSLFSWLITRSFLLGVFSASMDGLLVWLFRKSRCALTVPESSQPYLVGIGAGFGKTLSGCKTANLLIMDFKSYISKRFSAVAVHGLPRLEHLEFTDCDNVSALWVADCNTLNTLDLAGLIPRQEDRTPHSLQKLTIKACPQLTSVKGLHGLLGIKQLALCGCSLALVAKWLRTCPGARLLKALVIEPCSCCQPAACLQSLALATLQSPGSSVSLQRLTSLSRLELGTYPPQLGPQSASQQQQQQQQQHEQQQPHPAAAPSMQPHPAAAPSSSNQRSAIEQPKALLAVQGSADFLPQLPGASLLATLACLQVTAPGEPRQAQPADRSLGHVLLHKDQGLLQHGHIMQLTDCFALQQLQICTNLAEAHLTNCSRLTSLQLAAHPSTTAAAYRLRALVLHTCPLVQQLPSLDSAAALTRLELCHCPAVTTVTLGSSVQEVLLEACSSLASVTWSPQVAAAGAPALRRLQLRSCQALATLPDLLLPTTLALLEVRGCGRVAELQLPPSLVRACISSCGALARLEAAEHPPQQQQRPGAGGSAGAMATRQQGFAADSTQDGHTGGTTGHQVPAATTGEPQPWKLRVLRVDACPVLASIGGIPRLEQLRELTVRDCATLQSLELSQGLRELTVEACPQLTAVQCVAAQDPSAPAAFSQPVRLPFMARITINDCGQLKPAPCITHLPPAWLCKFMVDGGKDPVSWNGASLGSTCAFTAEPHPATNPQDTSLSPAPITPTPATPTPSPAPPALAVCSL